MKRAAVLMLGAWCSLAHADPPAGLRDSGDCGLPPSQPNTIRFQDGTGRYLYSFFETGQLMSIGITAAQITALDAEVARLKANRCYEVCVRDRSTGAAYVAAAENCDLLYIVNHGSKEPPYINPGGRVSARTIPRAPTTIRASTVWIGACFGQTIVDALNGPTGTRYRTLPRFDKDGTAGTREMIDGLIAELQKLTATRCELPQRVCVMSGIQDSRPVP